MDSPTILIVEDEAIIANSLQITLEGLGYQVCEILDKGEQAFEAVEKHQPDLVLMDIQLKGSTDGIQTAEQLSENSNPPPVIYLTAYADEGTLRRARITTPAGYILKPFDERELGICVDFALYKNRIERKLKEAETRFITTLKSIGEAVITTDIAGRITFMNFLAENLLQTKQEAYLQQNFAEVVPILEKDKPKGKNNLLRKALHTGIVYTLDNQYEIELHNGSLHNLSGTQLSPIIDDSGEVLGAVIVLKMS